MVKLKPEIKEEAVTKPKLGIDTSIFGYFNNLRSENLDDKADAGQKLIEHLKNKPSEDGKEAKYSIKRLIRGLGSSTNSSRSGFYSAFASYLSVATDLSITDLLAVLSSENVSNNNEEQKMFETYLGNVLACGSIIRSTLIETATPQELESLLDQLKKAAEAKKALIPYTMAFTADLIEKVSTENFASVVWPHIQADINVVRAKQTLNTIHCLMIARTNHSSVVTAKVLKSSLNTPTILHPDNFEWFTGLLWNIKSEIKSNHGFYEYFAKQLANSRHLQDFWSTALEKQLGESHKFNELLALKLAITVLQNLSDSNKPTFDLVTPNFTKVVLTHLKKANNSNDNLHPLYEEFFKLFLQHCEQITDGEVKGKILEQLIFDENSPVLEEKSLWGSVYSTLVMPLEEEALKGLCSRLKDLVAAEREESEDQEDDASKGKKLGALNLIKRILAHKLVANDAKLRLDYLKFLADTSIFNSAKKRSILLREKGLSLEQNLKLAFYSLLEHKLPKLSEEQNLLTSLVQHCEKRMKKVSVLDEESTPVWNKVMQKLVKSKPKATGKLNLNAMVFEILSLHMALQLFNNPGLARSSIAELESVMERVEAKKRKPAAKKSKKADAVEDEPEWIEVIVDLFLSLLSQDSSLLRNMISHIFPRLSKDITPTAFNQILSVLDLKENPLIATEQDENPDEIEESSDDDTDTDDDNKDASKPSKEEASSDDDEFLGDSDIEADDENQGNITDRVRSVIHAALGTAGAETDTESLDLDDMDVAEGRKVDDALAAAFKMLKAARKTKPTKTDRENDLQLNHFRMRVFDLIESYLKGSPSMACCLELMMFIYEQLPLAIKEQEKHQAILKKFHYIFNSLTKIKSFENCSDVSQAQLASLLSDLFQKVAKGASFPEKNACLSNSALFIIYCSKILAKTNAKDKDVIKNIFMANLKEFFTHRQPTLALNMLEIIFKLPWLVLWDLSTVITDTGLSFETRNLRRCNSLQLLTITFKNVRLIRTDVDVAATKLPAIETSINKYIEGLQQLELVSENEFNELLSLLVASDECHRRFPKIKSKVDMEQAKEVVQKLRPKVVLKAQETNVYTRVCKILQITPFLNKQLSGDAKKIAEKRQQKADNKSKKRQKNEERKQQNQAEKTAEPGKGKKNKTKPTNGQVASAEDAVKSGEKRRQKIDHKKAKRLKKEERMKVSAEGLIEDFSFIKSVNL